jgi:hypothetical protein
LQAQESHLLVEQSFAHGAGGARDGRDGLRRGLGDPVGHGGCGVRGAVDWAGGAVVDVLERGRRRARMLRCCGAAAERARDVHAKRPCGSFSTGKSAPPARLLRATALASK